MPGFHDAHLHYFHSALYLSPLAERFVGENEADAVARLAPLAARRPAGSWLLTQGWRDYLGTRPACQPCVAGCCLPRPTRGHVLRRRPHPVAEQLRAGTLGHHGGKRAARRRELRQRHRRAPYGHCARAAAMELMPRIVAEFSRELLDAYRSFERYLERARHHGRATCQLGDAGPRFRARRPVRRLEEAGELTVRVSMFPTLLKTAAVWPPSAGRPRARSFRLRASSSSSTGFPASTPPGFTTPTPTLSLRGRLRGAPPWLPK